MQGMYGGLIIVINYAFSIAPLEQEYYLITSQDGSPILTNNLQNILVTT